MLVAIDAFGLRVPSQLFLFLPSVSMERERAPSQLNVLADPSKIGKAKKVSLASRVVKQGRSVQAQRVLTSQAQPMWKAAHHWFEASETGTPHD